MAHNILGIDLGTHSVKVVVVEAGFRAARIVDWHERELLPPASDDETSLARAVRTFEALASEERLRGEMVATALGDEAILRLVSVPAAANRKQIEQMLGFELEGQVMAELDDLIYDFVLAGTSGVTTPVVAVAAKIEDIQARVSALQAVKAEPRLVGAAPLSYAALLGHGLTGGEAPEVVIDIGHKHTQVCAIAGGHVIFARSIARGGEDVSRAIAEAFRITPEAAEGAKKEQAFILAPGEQPQTPSHRRVDETVREAVRPLVRELRQTLAACRVGEVAPVAIALTGGGSKLTGLREHLEAELSLPVRMLGIPDGDALLIRPRGEPLDGALVPLAALGLALAVAGPVPQVNLRKGPLAYRTDYSYLRGKARALGIGVAVVLVCVALNGWAAYRALSKESDALESQLKRASMELFKEPRTDAKQIIDDLKLGPRGGAPPVPLYTALDILDEVTRKVPPTDKVRLDILDLDIRAKKTKIRGTVLNVQQLEQLITELKKIKCFTDIEQDKVKSVTGPAGEDGKPVEVKEFTLDISMTCL